MRKKLFAVIMSAMMMVTFMPSMSFAATDASVAWATDNSKATVTTANSSFNVTPVVNGDVYGWWGSFAWTLGTGSSSTYTFNGGSTQYNVTNSSVLDDVIAIDMQYAYVAYTESEGTDDLSTSADANVDAWRYSRDYKANSNKPANYYVTTVALGTGDLDTIYLNTEDYTVTYPAYEAYDYTAKTATTPGADKTGNIVVKLTDAGKTKIKNIFSQDGYSVYFKNDSYSKKLTFVTPNDVDDHYATFGMVDSADAVLVNGAATPYIFNYDGKEHKFGVLNTSKNTTVQYAVKKIEGRPWEITSTTPGYVEYNKAFVAADYSAAMPVLKNAGMYRLAVKQTYTRKDGVVREYESWCNVIVAPKYVRIVQKAAFTKQYDGEGFKLLNKYFNIYNNDGTSIPGICGKDNLFVQNPMTEANVGKYYVDINYSSPGINAYINPNYEIGNAYWFEDHSYVDDGYTYTDGVMVVNITKATSNKIKFDFTKKTLKAKDLKKAAKSLAPAKATHGGLILKKLSGSKKLSVKSGKVVVKKGTKKGTYKIKVKAYAKNTKNHVKAKAVTKTVTVKVK